MIVRTLEPKVRELCAAMPVVAVTGPRQSGKTTLCRATFPDYTYVSLEPLDVREFASEDPRGFLRDLGGPAILDEVQRTPELFSYLQEEVDRDPTPGRFLLTGSQHFGLSEAISQSLAGRVGILHLLPPSLDELRRFPDAPTGLWETLWAGAYPRIHDRGLDPARWLADYLATYVQRDVPQVLRVADLTTFTIFLRLAAGRTGQEENLSSLGADAGVSHPTIRAWLSVLETSFLLFRVPPWHRNLRKQVRKSAKVHFVDSGLACHLLGIRSPDQLRTHPLRGAVFESWVASEILKARLHRGHSPELYHLREARGLEIDLVVEGAREVIGMEAKSGATLASDFFTHLRSFRERLEADARAPGVEARLVYGGDRTETRTGVKAVPWQELHELAWW